MEPCYKGEKKVNIKGREERYMYWVYSYPIVSGFLLKKDVAAQTMTCLLECMPPPHPYTGLSGQGFVMIEYI